MKILKIFMKIAVIGCGRWGSFIAWYLDKIGNEVTLYGRETSEKMKNFLAFFPLVYTIILIKTATTTPIIISVG